MSNHIEKSNVEQIKAAADQVIKVIMSEITSKSKAAKHDKRVTTPN